MNITHPLDRPLNQADLILYCTHRSQSVGISTIKGDLAAIRNWHVERGWDWPDSKNRKREWPMLDRVLRGIEIKQGPKTKDKRKPISLTMLQELVNQANFDNFNDRAIACIMILLFFGLFRISELCSDSPMKQLCFKDITFHPSVLQPQYVKFKLPCTKSSQIHGEEVVMGITENRLCPVNAIYYVLLLRQKHILKQNPIPPTQTQPVFMFENNKPILRSHIRNKLKDWLKACKYDTKDYNTHSFRIGGATLLAKNGVSKAFIKAIGRWKSDVFMSYVRPCDVDIAALSKKFYNP